MRNIVPILAVFCIILLFEDTASAQGTESGSRQTPEQERIIQKLTLGEIDWMQKCYATIGQEKIKKFQQKSKEYERVLHKLCAAGRRDDAQYYATQYSQELEEDKTMKSIRKCTVNLPELVNKKYTLQRHPSGSNAPHICDIKPN